MPEIGSSGLMSGDGKRGVGHRPQATAPILDSTQADLGYWVCMFISGMLGTVIGDFCSHSMGLDDAGASILLSPIVAVLFLAGRGGRLLLLPFYWVTVVLI